MKFTFDLISDLHVESWPRFDWTGIATSPVAVVTGDIARDRNDLVEVLTHLGQNYQAVFYVDGNIEHSNFSEMLSYSYVDLIERLQHIPNLVYLQDNVVVIDGVAILGTNGWWGFDFDYGIPVDEAMAWCQDQMSVSRASCQAMAKMAAADAQYMYNSVKRLQTHSEVKKIIITTHTVPDAALISHDLELCNHPRFNIMGNSLMQQVLNADTENKIHTWCFGHYHSPIDQVRQGVRYLNHCRGQGGTSYVQHVYYPKRITIEY